jgi:phage terminase large subunit-like protein
MLQVIIKHDKSGSIFSRLSKDDKKSGDGSNPHFVILDEYHLHETTEYYDQATSGQKLRVNPLLSIITTAGFNLNNPCYRIEYQYVNAIIDPDNPITNDRYFVSICELDKNDTTEPIEINGKIIEPGQPIDDINSMEAIQKTNPILCTNKIGIESIKNEVYEAEGKPEKMRDVLTKTFNFWINQRDSGYMDMTRWSVCTNQNYAIPTGNKHTPYCGVDLSSTIDLTSIAFIINLQPDIQYVLSHSFIPEDSIDKASRRDNVPYSEWVKGGWLTATPGSEVDYHLVLDYIVSQYKIYGWNKGEVCYDKHLATWLKQELSNKSFTPVEIWQSYTGLSLATKEFRAKVYNKKIIHQEDPLLNWSMGNAVIRCGPSENIMLDKKAAKFRIDPVAAIINAFVRAIANEKQKGRVFII